MGKTKVTFENVTVSGYDVHVYSSGLKKKPIFVLVHGVGVSHAYYEPFMNILSKQYSVMAVDLPGFGTTEEPRKVLSIDELAEIVVKTVHKYKLRDCVLVGHSMGTQVVVAAASQHPKICRKVILLAPTVDDKERNFFEQLALLLKDSLREPLKLKAIVFRDYLLSGPVRMVKTVNSMLQDDMEDDVRKLRMPVLIIDGKRDPIASISWAKKLVKMAKHGVYGQVDGPHAFQFTKPDETARLCENFIGKS